MTLESFSNVKVYDKRISWGWLNWCFEIMTKYRSYYSLLSYKPILSSSFFSPRIVLTFTRVVKGMNKFGASWFWFLLLYLLTLPLAPQVSVASMLPAIPQFLIFTSPSNYISLRIIMVEVWLFSSLWSHLLKNLRSLLSKHEKLAAESLGVLCSVLSLAVHG